MLTATDIQLLWKQGGAFRDIAASEVVDNFNVFHALFFELLSGSEPDALVCQAKSRFLFLNKGLGFNAKRPSLEDCALFGDEGRMEHLFFDAMQKHAELLDNAQREGFLHRLIWAFPEIKEDISDLFGIENKVVQRDTVAKNHQLMIFVTGRCNLRCPYCFSTDIEKNEISAENLLRIFDWAEREGVDKITPCGGEPLLYRHLGLFLQEIEQRKIQTYFATNLTVDIRRFKGMQSHIVHKLYAHLTEETMGTPRLLDVFLGNLDEARLRGIHVVGRININSLDREPLYKALELFHSKGIDRVNVALTIPSTNSTNSYTPIDEFGRRIPVLLSVLERAGEMGIQTGVAKPLPLCRFPREMLASVVCSDMGYDRCGIDEDCCMADISLSPSMNFSPCLGLENTRVPFSETLTWNDLRMRFEPLVKELLRKPLYPQCRKCYLWHRGLCQGSCLSYKTMDK